jgi:RNA polymerase sigma-70 factor (ECF subfamily)
VTKEEYFRLIDKRGDFMTDLQIIDLYWNRDQDAISRSEQKYGAYCFAVANNILADTLDSEECVSDTWLRSWNAIPPQRPDNLKLFLARITRNLSLDRLDYLLAKKRNSDMELLLAEAAECIPSESVEQAAESVQITEALNRLLYTLDQPSRVIFVERYWYAKPIKEIAYERHYSESKVKSSLFRTRKKLKVYLEQEGISL